MSPSPRDSSRIHGAVPHGRSPARQLSVERQAAENFLLGRINFEHAAAVPYGERALKLARMRELLARLGDPQLKVPVIHIAGTKGKGSVAAMVASVLNAAGHKVGLALSPHVTCIEERFGLWGEATPPEVLIDAVAELRPIVAEMDREAIAHNDHGPTYFELTAAIAFWHYARTECDAAVVEVGLGGRLDATNVCQPTVTAITSISFDHTKQLGNTLAAIATEKAGIIKAGVPVVSGVLPAEPRETIARIAAEREAPLRQLDRDFSVTVVSPATWRKPASFQWQNNEGIVIEELPLPHLGEHQHANATVALGVLAELNRHGWTITAAAMRAGLQASQLPARMEVLAEEPRIVVDAAHNVASAQSLAAALPMVWNNCRRKTLLLAIARDKQIEPMLAALVPLADEVVLTRFVSNPRAETPARLAELARPLASPGATVNAFEALEDAWQHCRNQLQADDGLCVAGSFFLAAEFREFWLAQVDARDRDKALPPS